MYLLTSQAWRRYASSLSLGLSRTFPQPLQVPLGLPRRFPLPLAAVLCLLRPLQRLSVLTPAQHRDEPHSCGERRRLAPAELEVAVLAKTTPDGAGKCTGSVSSCFSNILSFSVGKTGQVSLA